MESYTKEKLKPEQIEQMRQRMKALIEFLEVNDISPSDAVPMAMRFVACTCNGYIDKKTLVSLFKCMVESVYKGEE